MKASRLFAYSATLLLILLIFPVIASGTGAVESDLSTPPAQSQVSGEGGNALEQKRHQQVAGVPSIMDAEQSAMSQWLHMLDKKQSAKDANSSVLAFAPEFPGDLARAFNSIGHQENKSGFWGVLFRSMIAIGLGFLAAYIVSRTARNRITMLQDLTPPDNQGLAFFWAGVLRSLPALVSTLLIATVSTITFLLLAGNVGLHGRMLFQALLGIVLIVHFCSIISTVIFSPEAREIRLFTIADSLVKPLHRAVFISFSLLFSGMLIVNLVYGLGAKPQTMSWLIMLLGTTIISVCGYLVFVLRKPVTTALLEGVQQEGSWVREQLFTYWHLPALFYLLLVWFIWVGQELTGSAVRNGSFIISLLIIPIYFVLSIAGKAVNESIVDSLQLDKGADENNLSEAEKQELEVQHKERRNTLIAKIHLVYRLLLVASLLAWVFSLWGYPIPYAANAVRALFESLVTVGLALVCWRFTSAYIERKIAEATPEVEEKEEEVDDEFGGAVARGRSHTLLPMLRKVIGTVLVVMVMLIVISSLGVNIGPLLAGAGVIGLAVGFGAQKLVSDIFSGFFYLLDDAFRVGEYIEAGSIRGSVETITLRNVMLRHHLGMLQVVPHSDLGAITNYMRGGIVIKFPLEFPYDTDIDKVRKIIKKVGVAMLEDPEIGEDFLQPVKSQGVNQITNSVMVIRVKFTAKPGKQFVIKREAFRRITEALNSKGIYYAHRKVIVDFPEEFRKEELNEEAKKKVLEAGAAAAIISEQEEQEQKKTDEGAPT
ncbi:MAG: mechanosensitive ion channel family protein [Desulforhopalus sp.]